MIQMLCTFAVSFVDIETLINYVTFVMWAQKAVTVSALLYIRYSKMPVAECEAFNSLSHYSSFSKKCE